MVRAIRGTGVGRIGDAAWLPSGTRPTTVATLNLSPKPGDVRHNLLLAAKELVGAKRVHPDLEWAVLPELFTSGYSSLAEVHRHAEDARRGRSVRWFRALARSLNLRVAYGFPERLPGSGGVSDSANLVGPEGLLLTYRKLRLVRETGEDRIFAPGTNLPVIEAGGLGVALAICWDLGFPEVVRGAALEGAELILVPAGWREPYGPQYELSCAARALDNGIFVASANQLGYYPEARFGTPGGLYGPDGLRVSEPFGERHVGRLDPAASAGWRRCYGSTVQESTVDAVLLEACS